MRLEGRPNASVKVIWAQFSVQWQANKQLWRRVNQEAENDGEWWPTKKNGATNARALCEDKSFVMWCWWKARPRRRAHSHAPYGRGAHSWALSMSSLGNMNALQGAGPRDTAGKKRGELIDDCSLIANRNRPQPAQSASHRPQHSTTAHTTPQTPAHSPASLSLDVYIVTKMRNIQKWGLKWVRG